MFIMTVAFFTDETKYILNLFVQSVGYYFQNIVQLGFHTDAFEQVSPSYGGVETRNRYIPEGYDAPDGPDDWLDSWTMFYWGWWASWCPFVGKTNYHYNVINSCIIQNHFIQVDNCVVLYNRNVYREDL